MRITEEKLYEFETRCVEAVEYVGSANYPEREREALCWVRKAFMELYLLLQEEK